jgi:Glycosyl transferases group 1
MINVIDIVYYSHRRISDPAQVLARHAPSLGFADFINNEIRFEFVIHMDHEGFENIRGKSFSFFKRRNRFWQIPFKTHRYIKGKKPDIVIVEGLEFPLQLMFLKFALGKKCRIIAQHHGEKPPKGIKAVFGRLADKCIRTYLFTSSKNASGWIDKKIIKSPDKCLEVLEASTYFKRMDRSKCQAKLGLRGNYNFLWLYMIFHEDDLLEEIKGKIRQSVVLEDAVKLIGKVDHADLVYWYSAANFYISASHKEGSGYALLEAMACGCIPIVTSIPSFEKITSLGRFGFLFPPGDENALVLQLEKLKTIHIESFRQKVETWFHENLSFKSIAYNLGQVISQI